MKRLRLGLVLCIFWPALARGDVVELTDGRIYRGKVTREGKLLIIKMDYGRVELNAADVKRWVRTEPATQPKAETPAPPSPRRTRVPLFAATDATRPESVAFLLMRRLPQVEPGTASYELRQLILRRRRDAHDRLRKLLGHWRHPKDFQIHRGKFQRELKTAEDLLGEIEAIRGDEPQQRKKRKRLRAEASKGLLTAARSWGDPLLRQFLMGVAHYHNGDYREAEKAFRTCRRDMPLLAAGAQGHWLSLLKVNQPVKALAAATEVLRLRPDSRDALRDLREAMKRVPGARAGSETFLLAQALSSQYEDAPKRSFRRRKGIVWLLPKNVTQSRRASLPVPSYDHLVFRQAVGVPVGSRTLLVDEATVRNAVEIYVRLGDGTLVPGRTRRVTTFGSRKPRPPLTLVTVEGRQFTPVGFSAEAKFAANAQVTLYSLGMYMEMGRRVHPITAMVTGTGADGIPGLSGKLFAGDSAGPVIAGDGRLVGFLAGKTDVNAPDGGPDNLIGPADLAGLVKRAAKGRARGFGFRRARRKVTVRPAPGAHFIVYGIETERLD